MKVQKRLVISTMATVVGAGLVGALSVGLIRSASKAKAKKEVEADEESKEDVKKEEQEENKEEVKETEEEINVIDDEDIEA